MPEQADLPLKPDAAGADQSKYLVYSRLEIAMILGTLAKNGSMVTAYFDSGYDFILTSIAAVRPDKDAVYIDYGADAAANQRALQSRRITFVAAHERIKIQFAAEALRPARLAGREVFHMALPQTLLRLQRREYFRIATPVTRPLICAIPPQAEFEQAPERVTVLDISCGGIAVLDSSQPSNVETGMRLTGCRVALPELGEVASDLVIRSTYELTFRNGAQHRRAGCEFVGMRERDRALIQRYISRLERERKDRAGGR